MKQPMHLLCRAMGLMLMLFAAVAGALACTTLSVRSDGGVVVSIMNMEFPDNLGYTLNHFPVGISYQGAQYNGAAQKRWRGKHQVIGTGGKSNPQAIGAGLNDRGLYVTTTFLEEKTRYQVLRAEDEGNFVEPPLLPTYLLSQFESIDEVKQALSEIRVVGVPSEGFYNVVPTYHWMVTDKKYNSIVIEYTNGELVVFDNPYHAMTNAPTFDFHLNNMRNYPHLSNRGSPPDGADVKSTGIGYGTLGLPGDYTPTGRFVRAAFWQADR